MGRENFACRALGMFVHKPASRAFSYSKKGIPYLAAMALPVGTSVWLPGAGRAGNKGIFCFHDNLASVSVAVKALI
jgi:hypothetical protein